MERENRRLRNSLEESQAKVAEQELTISRQNNEINELKMKIKNGDDKMKKMEQSTVSLKNQVDRVNTENRDLKRKIDELQELLNKER